MLLALWAAIVWVLHSSFLAFSINFSDTIEYNKAYYSAVSSLERAELVLRYRQPWFQGTGGWNGDVSYGNEVDYKPTSDFSYISDENQNWLHWKIESRSRQIPAPWEGNVDWLLVGEDINGNSLDYNMLDYRNAENFIFELDSLDTDAANPYLSGDSRVPSAVASFSGMIRLPPLLRYDYLFSDLIGENDAMVDWSLRGKFNDNEFMIFPTVKQHSNGSIDLARDSVIRGIRINEDSSLNFSDNVNPFDSNSNTGYNVISYVEDQIEGREFSELLDPLSSNPVTAPVFRIALLNLLISQNELFYSNIFTNIVPFSINV